jgi:hypothetical protein
MKKLEKKIALECLKMAERNFKTATNSTPISLLDTAKKLFDFCNKGAKK